MIQKQGIIEHKLINKRTKIWKELSLGSRNGDPRNFKINKKESAHLNWWH